MKHSADNTSLLREIQQLRAELEELQNEPPLQATDMLELFCRTLREGLEQNEPTSEPPSI